MHSKATKRPFALTAGKPVPWEEGGLATVVVLRSRSRTKRLPLGPPRLVAEEANATMRPSPESAG
jgi:hypothetical protein